MTIELGGGITLDGFSDLRGGELVVVKKLVGRYAREMSESCKAYGGLNIKRDLHPQTNHHQLHAIVLDGDKKRTAKVIDPNLYVALDAVLKRALKKI